MYVLEERKRDSQAKLSCDVGQRVSCGFTSQGGAPGETGVYLNDVVLEDKRNILLGLNKICEDLLFECTHLRANLVPAPILG